MLECLPSAGTGTCYVEQTELGVIHQTLALPPGGTDMLLAGIVDVPWSARMLTISVPDLASQFSIAMIVVGIAVPVIVVVLRVLGIPEVTPPYVPKPIPITWPLVLRSAALGIGLLGLGLILLVIIKIAIDKGTDQPAHLTDRQQVTIPSVAEESKKTQTHNTTTNQPASSLADNPRPADERVVPSSGRSSGEGTPARPPDAHARGWSGGIAKKPVPLPSPEVEKSYVPSGWMSKSTNELSAQQAEARLQNLLRLESVSGVTPHSRPTCYRITFTPAEEWVGLAWQYPDGNWGYWPGRNASGYSRVTLWARSDGTGVHTVEFLAGGHARAGLPWQASCQAVELWCDLGQEWKQYTIDLRGRDLTNLPVGFVLVIRRTENPNGCTIYLDDIRFEK